MAGRSYLLYRKVYEGLRGRILSGNYDAGARIETELDLTRQFRVSLITVRQAEQMLVADGLLVKRQGSGTFVTDSLAKHQRFLCVCGIYLEQGLHNRLGSYYSDVLVFSQQEAAKRGVECETVWLPTREPERVIPYGKEQNLRQFLGFVFVGCGWEHALLEQVCKFKLHYATISAWGKPKNSVWLDYAQAIRLALSVFDDDRRRPPLVLGFEGLAPEVASVVKTEGYRGIRQALVSNSKDRVGFEEMGYRRILDLIEKGEDVSRLLLLDDVLARGATRALLKAGYTDKKVKLAVICGKQEMIPLGLPCTFIVHDTEEEVRHAFQILEQQQRERVPEVDSYCSQFSILPG
jgi:hypothetical protein